jgi:hypothetical protein
MKDNNYEKRARLQSQTMCRFGEIERLPLEMKMHSLKGPTD